LKKAWGHFKMIHREDIADVLNIASRIVEKELERLERARGILEEELRRLEG